MSILMKLKNRTRWLLSFPIDKINQFIYPNPIVKSIDETIQKIVSERCSVCRYGDGEFNIMFGNSIDFQHYDKRLADKMRNILRCEEEKCLVCLCDNFYDNRECTREVRIYWKRFMRLHRAKLGRLLKKGKIYYNTWISRFYLRYVDKSRTDIFIEKLRLIWEQKRIVFVEGEKSRLGVGNDLFNNALSIKRVLCPAENAFDYYDEIIDEIKKNVGMDELILIALGPTATAMAYDLHMEGYQAIDIGHIDIEYEWYRMGATTKVPVKNKYTNEAVEGKNVGEIFDAQYQSQIILRIGEK